MTITKKQAIEFAKEFNWTAKDAERAFANLDLKQADEQDLLIALVKFAGINLLKRQRLQAAQKRQVTQKNNYIKKIEVEFVEKFEEQNKTIQEMRSIFLPVIARLYNFAKPFGLNDPWIEAMLATYEQYSKEVA